VHEARTDAAKAALFADCRAGRVAVLLGSTDKLGVGTNIQDRCVAIHHVDAPWRPADVEQREGRGLRPGNHNRRVRVIRYVTEGSFDSPTPVARPVAVELVDVAGGCRGEVLHLASAQPDPGGPADRLDRLVERPAGGLDGGQLAKPMGVLRLGQVSTASAGCRLADPGVR
jgi:hypothetical protein